MTAAQANLAVLKAQQDDALSFLRQQQSLNRSGVIAQREVDVAQTAYQTATARYNQGVAQLNQAKLSEQVGGQFRRRTITGAGAAVAGGFSSHRRKCRRPRRRCSRPQAAITTRAEVNLAHTTITSPIDGVVVSRDVNVGQTVAASLSAPTLFTIANDLTKMQVIANIDQADIGLVEKAKSVKFTRRCVSRQGVRRKDRNRCDSIRRTSRTSSPITS